VFLRTTPDEALKLFGSQRYQLLLLDQDQGAPESANDGHHVGDQSVVAVTTYETLDAAVTGLASSGSRGAGERSVVTPSFSCVRSVALPTARR
jgi:hypothetical protein